MTTETTDDSGKPKKRTRATKAAAPVQKETEIQGENGTAQAIDTPDASAEGHTAAQGGEAAPLSATNTEGVGAGQPDGPQDMPAAEADQAAGNAGGGDDVIPAAQNTEGANDAGDTAEALLQAPGDPAGSAPVQGGEAETLPATHDAPPSPVVDAVGNGPAADAAASAVGGPADITVICHAKGGRRRLGRRWPDGETTVAEGDLSDTDIALLRGDPRFTVLVPAT